MCVCMRAYMPICLHRCLCAQTRACWGSVWCAGVAVAWGASWRIAIRSSRPQDRTCVSGRPCAVDGVQGRHLADGDRIWVLGTCGTGLTLPRFDASAAVHAVAQSGARADWGSVAITSAAGRYRLCWCAAASRSCSAAENFRVDFGELSVLGVTPLLQDHHGGLCSAMVGVVATPFQRRVVEGLAVGRPVAPPPISCATSLSG